MPRPVFSVWNIELNSTASDQNFWQAGRTHHVSQTDQWVQVSWQQRRCQSFCSVTGTRRWWAANWRTAGWCHAIDCSRSIMPRVWEPVLRGAHGEPYMAGGSSTTVDLVVVVGDQKWVAQPHMIILISARILDGNVQRQADLLSPFNSTLASFYYTFDCTCIFIRH